MKERERIFKHFMPQPPTREGDKVTKFELQFGVQLIAIFELTSCSLDWA